MLYCDNSGGITFNLAVIRTMCLVEAILIHGFQNTVFFSLARCYKMLSKSGFYASVGPVIKCIYSNCKQFQDHASVHVSWYSRFMHACRYSQSQPNIYPSRIAIGYCRTVIVEPSFSKFGQGEKVPFIETRKKRAISF